MKKKTSQMAKAKEKFRKTWENIQSRCKKGGTYYLKGRKCEWKSFREFERDMFKSFLAHNARYGGQQTTIERRDNDGNYSKKNCRWATPLEQQNNRTNNRKITAFGVTRTVTEWARFLGLKESTLRNRFNRSKLPVEIAITPKKLSHYVRKTLLSKRT